MSITKQLVIIMASMAIGAAIVLGYQRHQDPRYQIPPAVSIPDEKYWEALEAIDYELINIQNELLNPRHDTPIEQKQNKLDELRDARQRVLIELRYLDRYGWRIS